MAAKYSFTREGELIVVTEEWRLDDPDLPFIVNPWHPAKAEIEAALSDAKWVGTRWAMSETEYRARFGDAPPSA